jgi:hypothetical protein
MLSLTLLLVLAAFIATIASAMAPPRAPLWVAVLLLCVAMLVGLLPK